jgi:hypothetical protein
VAAHRTILWLIALASTLVIALGGGLVLGLVVLKHEETGRWALPDMNDITRVLQPRRASAPTRTIYLDRAAQTITPGMDDAAHRVSGVVRVHHPDGPVTVPGWRGSVSSWQKLVSCVKKQFAAFDITISDQPPVGGDFTRVVFGARPADIGVKDKRITGLSPFDGGVIPDAIVFAFAAQLGNQPRPLCETIAHEIAHTYGVDHEYLCKDVMTYLGGCGTKTFVNQLAPCGEKAPAPCASGEKAQNSYLMLMNALGPKRVSGAKRRPRRSRPGFRNRRGRGPASSRSCWSRSR